MKKIVILGSTGSIGENTLKIVEALPGEFEVVGLVAHTQAARIVEQALRHRVKDIVLADPQAAQEATRLAGGKVTVHSGVEAVCGLAAMSGVDIVVCAMVGMAALKPVLAAINAGHDVALATKEVLVSAGELVMRARARQGVRLLPIDSEHSALFQCLQSATHRAACVHVEGDGFACASEQVGRLVLTASGGPFALHPEIDFEKVTPKVALAHPRWSMGRKVTVDSATMMNKGLEILEARWLFDVPTSQIDVVVHPESVVHSMVTFVDGASVAQLSVPDMRFAIQYALTWPARVAAEMPRLDLTQMRQLTFHAPDSVRFPCLRLIREAAATGGTMPAVLNAADEVAVGAFLAGRVSFPGIWNTIERVTAAHTVCACTDLETVIEADAWARRAAKEEIGL